MLRQRVCRRIRGGFFSFCMFFQRHCSRTECPYLRRRLFLRLRRRLRLFTANMMIRITPIKSIMINARIRGLEKKDPVSSEASSDGVSVTAVVGVGVDVTVTWAVPTGCEL